MGEALVGAKLEGVTGALAEHLKEVFAGRGDDARGELAVRGAHIRLLGDADEADAGLGEGGDEVPPVAL